MAHPGKIQSVENAFEIIEFLRDERTATQATIADHVGLSESTTHYYLTSLDSKNVVRKDGTKYTLGYKLLEYGGIVKARNQLYSYAKQHMDRIAMETDLAVYLGIEDRKQVVHIAAIEIEGTSIIGDHDGKRTDFHSAALGKAILAYLPEDKLETILREIEYPAFTAKTITDPDDLRSYLDAVVDQGYAINDEEDYRGWKGIAVPILSETGVDGALSVAGPKSKIDHQQDNIIRMLQEAKDEIELISASNNKPTRDKSE